MAVKLQNNPFCWILLLAGICNACISTKNWGEDEYLLRSQEIEGNEHVNTERLTGLFRQKKNHKIGPFHFYIWAYNYGNKIHNPEEIQKKKRKTEQKYNTKIDKYEAENYQKKVQRLILRRDKKIKKIKRNLEEGNWFMRSVGEAPIFYDSLEAKNTAKEMEKFLRIKGYFQGKVKVETRKTKNKRAEVVYHITENEPVLLGDITYTSGSKNIDSLLMDTKAKSVLQKGIKYDEEKMSKEQQRIEKLLKNNGYFYFSRQYINFWIDTTGFDAKAKEIDSLSNQTNTQEVTKTQTRAADIEIVVNDPKDGKHKVYHLNKVYFHILKKKGGSREKINSQQKHHINRKKGEIDTLQSPETGIDYIYRGKRINYNYYILDSRTHLYPGKLYRENRRVETQRSLSLLNMFKFVNINPDTLDGKLDIHIFTTPMERYQLTDEIGFNVIQGLPGPFVNVSLKNRNTFGNAEIFENSFRFSIDGQTSFSDNSRFYSNQEIGLSSSLTFPRVLFPYRLIPKKLRHNLDYFNPTTQLGLGYSFTRRIEYTRSNLTASISYKGQLRNTSYQFTLSELSVVNTTSISEEFATFLSKLSQEVQNSFNRALVSSMYFVYTFNNNKGNETKRAHYLRILAESGGTTLNLLNQSRVLEGNRIFGLQIFQFWKFNPTFHYYWPISKKGYSLAFRANAGIAIPYGKSNSLPYEKFFFIGGSNSMRAWASRRLGPGRFRPEQDSTTGVFNYQVEQPGEIILEGNIEYRFPVFSFIKGAVFLDAGNVWLLKDDPERPGVSWKAQTFFEEIALGTGFGLRFNLPFLLLRFDLGLKLYNPAKLGVYNDDPDNPAPETLDRDPWVIKGFNILQPFKKDLLLLNIGIGYPF